MHIIAVFHLDLWSFGGGKYQHQSNRKTNGGYEYIVSDLLKTE
jgi:hypothetical protein